ncbi:MAG: helix-turn-helix domain-containing protein [Vicinamibacterales bacterium]
MREDLEKLVAQMVDRGVHFADARREFERQFIACALDRTESVSAAADLMGLHRNSLSRKIVEYRIRHKARERGGARG